MSVPPWCESRSSYYIEGNIGNNEIKKIKLQPSAVAFLDHLNLPTFHPICKEFESGYPPQSAAAALMNKNQGITTSNGFESVVTVIYQAVPAVAAISELWLRLFAFYVFPLCAAFLLWTGFSNPVSDRSILKNSKQQRWQRIVTILGLACGSVLYLDEQYQHEFNHINDQEEAVSSKAGQMMLGAMCMLVCWTFFVSKDGKHHDKKEKSQNGHDSKSTKGKTTSNYKTSYSDRVCQGSAYIALLASLALLLAPYCDLDLDIMQDDLPQFPPGFYYDPSNPLIAEIASSWPASNRTYETSQSSRNGSTWSQDMPTPWLITGDSRTGIPFLVNSVPRQSYHRLWVPIPKQHLQEEKYAEAVALDIAFPPGGHHDVTKPLYVILHGLNGGSEEEFIQDLVHRETLKGHTVAVMIARGLMDTPILGKAVFHGARVSDIAETARVLHQAVSSLAQHNGEERRQVVIGAGYSMGAIILANYVARSASDCHLDGAISVSGGLDMRAQLTFTRSMRLWQPMLANGLREIVLGKFRALYQEKLSKEQFLHLLRAPDVSTLDEHAVVAYNGFDSITHYYAEMSAMGDWVRFDGTREKVGRIGNVSIPFCVLHALDDPLVTWKTVIGSSGEEAGGAHPRHVVQSGSGHIMMVLTKSGGHVGWPLGLNPKVKGWEWMNGVVSGFATSVDAAIKKK